MDHKKLPWWDRQGAGCSLLLIAAIILGAACMFALINGSK